MLNLIRSAKSSTAGLAVSALYLFLAAFFVIGAANTGDEDLSDSARRGFFYLKLKGGVDAETNGFLLMLGLFVRPGVDPIHAATMELDALASPSPTVQRAERSLADLIPHWCFPERAACVGSVPASLALDDPAIQVVRSRVSRLHDMAYTDTHRPTFDGNEPSYGNIITAQQLVIADALRAHAQGDSAETWRMLTRDAQFLRRVLSESSHMLPKQIALVALQRNALVAAEVFHEDSGPQSASRTMYVKSALADITLNEADMEQAVRIDYALLAQTLWGSENRPPTKVWSRTGAFFWSLIYGPHASRQLPFDRHVLLEDGRRVIEQHPWRKANRFIALFYRPNQTANELLSVLDATLELAKAERNNYLNAVQRVERAHREAREKRGLIASWLINPVALRLGNLTSSAYFARLHDLNGVLGLVRARSIGHEESCEALDPNNSRTAPLLDADGRIRLPRHERTLP